MFVFYQGNINIICFSHRSLLSSISCQLGCVELFVLASNFFKFGVELVFQYIFFSVHRIICYVCFNYANQDCPFFLGFSQFWLQLCHIIKNYYYSYILFLFYISLQTQIIICSLTSVFAIPTSLLLKRNENQKLKFGTKLSQIENTANPFEFKTVLRIFKPRKRDASSFQIKVNLTVTNCQIIM
ncbi:Hypothetical_protein [Hexamita inflata]|uniref:Hypothetical_protein n=1 Tax=Hexamita inflata TaxID=28002 RepID=A0AA86UDF6_9EUKA|nr:Hypothetical protein HINF_LOCUS35251 [Hexamita inflata]